MTEPADVATKDAFEGAIRSFTEAEIALREIVTGLQRFRSASDQVGDAESSLASARASVEASATAVESAVTGLTEIAGSLAAATAVIAALDPERFWASLERIESGVAGSREATVAAVAESQQEVMAEQRRAASSVTDAVAKSQEAIVDAGHRDVSALTAVVNATGDRLDGSVTAAAGRVTAAGHDESVALKAQVDSAIRVATQARALAVVTTVLAAVATALLVLLVLR